MSDRDSYSQRKVFGYKLADVHLDAITAPGVHVHWRGAREVGVMGSTMNALARRGLADVRWATKPRRMVYRLTPAGIELRCKLAMAAGPEVPPDPPEVPPDPFEWAPVEHTPIPVRCTHCGAEFPDGTPGGSCSCGLPVEAI